MSPGPSIDHIPHPFVGYQCFCTGKGTDGLCNCERRTMSLYPDLVDDRILLTSILKRLEELEKRLPPA